MHTPGKWGVLKLILFTFLEIYELIYRTRDKFQGKLRWAMNTDIGDLLSNLHRTF